MAQRPCLPTLARRLHRAISEASQMLKRAFKKARTEPTLSASDIAQDSGSPSGFDQNSTQIWKIDGYRLALGLTWTEADSLKTAKRFVGKNNAYLTLSVSGQLNVAKGTSQMAGCYAGAALVAKLLDNALVFQKIAEETFWICLIKDGIPQPTFDRIVYDAEEAKQAYSTAAEYIPHDGVIVGDTINARYTIQKIIEAAKELKSDELQQCRLRKNGLDIRKIFAATLLLTAAAAGSYFIATQRENLRNEERRLAALKALLQTQQEKRAQEQRIANLIQQYQDKIASEQRKFGLQEVALSQWHECEQVRKSLPYTSMGYKPAILRCDFQAKKATIEWSPANSHTRIADRTKLPGILDPLNTEGPIVSDFPIGRSAVHGNPAQKVDPRVVKMAIMDWSSRNLKNLKFSQEEEVTLRPPSEIKGLAGVSEYRLGRKIHLQLNTASSSDLLSMHWAVELLNKYPINFERVIWSNPTAVGAQVSAFTMLYILE
ncbi:hypothetical protein [Delftia tsuruhatensis]|uniref:hypothetical protein n=1 Tax=Delftia tsuruhatensis TaxID=180282 RepID=UPI002AD5B4A3|nr:hypothetical protein [Delftia tsuruhatensis]WQM86000.1 hypothetical protein RNT40_14445 [Delftia tsuruhatensis]